MLQMRYEKLARVYTLHFLTFLCRIGEAADSGHS